MDMEHRLFYLKCDIEHFTFLWSPMCLIMYDYMDIDYIIGYMLLQILETMGICYFFLTILTIVKFWMLILGEIL